MSELVLNRRRYSKATSLPFFLMHAAVLTVFLFPFHWSLVAWLAGSYFLRMFFVTAGYHRYFSHRSYRLNRFWQFVVAFMSQTSAQKGVLWWAAHHRFHHKHSDDPMDLHSPRQRGFWYAHVGWMFSGNEETDYKRIPDFAGRPELRWLNEHWLVPPVLLGVASFLALGWSGLFVGFFLSTVLLYHATFSINSVMYKFGTQRYESNDESRNSVPVRSSMWRRCVTTIMAPVFWSLSRDCKV